MYEMTFHVVRERVKHQFKGVSTITTFCRLYLDNNLAAQGQAYCSEKDKYNHIVGLRLAFEDAVHKLPREQREEWWYNFMVRTGWEPTMKYIIEGTNR